MTVPERMLSLAIGREGQNARLAARLTGWRIDIRSDVSVAEAEGAAARRPDADAPAEAATAARPAEPRPLPRRRSRVAEAERDAGRCGARPSRGRRRRAPRRSRASGRAPRRRRDRRGRRAATPKATRHEASAARRRGEPTAVPRRRAAARPAKPKRAHREGRRRPRRWRRRPRPMPATVAPRRVPTRTCVACRTVRPKRELRADRPDARRPDASSTRPVAGRSRRLRLPRRPPASTSPSSKGALSRALEAPLPPALLRERSPATGAHDTTTSKEEPVARSRSGTRGRRGPRKPPRRDGAFGGAASRTLDPRERGAIELPGTITVKELAELLGGQPGGHHPRADQERHLRDHQPARSTATPRRSSPASSATRWPRPARVAGGGGRRRGDGPAGEADQGGPLRGGRSGLPPAARPDRDRHGPRRPRQDEPARRDPHDRASRPASAAASPSTSARSEVDHDGKRVVFLDTPGPRGVHRDARPRRAGHRHRGRRRRRRRRRHAPDARGDQPRQGGQGADHHRASTRSTSPTPTRTGSRPS